jgi:hypothetical protein
MINSYRFYIVAAAALLTNGMSLLGVAHESAGGIARALECKSCLSRNAEIVSAIELLSQPLTLNSPPAAIIAVKPAQLGTKLQQPRQTPESRARSSARQ